MIEFEVRPPDKRRFTQGLRPVEIAEISYHETEFSPRIVSAILGKDVSVRSYSLPAPDYVEFCRKVGLDVAYLCAPWPLGRREAVDRTGQLYYVDGLIKDWPDLKDVLPPDFGMAERRIEEFLEAAAGSGLGWTFKLPAACNIETAIGFENYYKKIYDDPAFIEELMKRCEEYTMALTELVLRFDPDAVLLGTGVCFKSGLIMDPDKIERFVLAPIRTQMSLIRESGVPAIMHSDGDNSAMMECWINLGFSGFHPVEPCGDFDIYTVKARWGERIALLGNINVAGVLSQGTPEEVARDTLTHLERLSPGGGYICGSSHDIVDSIPLANLKAMVETVAKTNLAASC
jgi:uroporphyrinogen decarboxylase